MKSVVYAYAAVVVAFVYVLLFVITYVIANYFVSKITKKKGK